MNNLDNGFPMEVNIVVMSPAQLTAVYALLGGASTVAVAMTVPHPTAAAPTLVEEQSDVAAVASLPASDDSDGEIDIHGHPWSADLHASTKGKTKDGLWRMKVGVTRPDPLPGFPVEDASPANPDANTATEPAGSSQTQAPESVPASQDGNPAAGNGDDDEFAAFRAAAAKSDAEDAAAKANVPARKWTDADLGALCNQAATKLGDPSPVKEIIAKFVPEGQVAHSRNIPEDTREDFAKAVEAKAGIEFAG